MTSLTMRSASHPQSTTVMSTRPALTPLILSAILALATTRSRTTISLATIAQPTMDLTSTAQLVMPPRVLLATPQDLSQTTVTPVSTTVSAPP